VLNRTDLDALGRPHALRTYDASSGTLLPEAVITLTDDVQDNLVQVEHPAGIGVTSMSYDLAGRKTSMGDVDMGLWRYAHDRRGNLTQQTDARSKATCLAYDVLGRLLHKDFHQDSDNPADCANPTYDLSYLYDANHAPDNPSRGQLSGVRYNDGSYGADLAYNEQGLLRQKNATLMIAGALDINVTQYGYDAYQRPTTTTYPDGEVVNLTYNGMGLPTSLTSSLPPTATLTTLVNGVSYDEAGRLTQLGFPAGGGLVRKQTYVPWNQPDSTGGLLSTIQIKPASGDSLLHLAYTYDSFGNVHTLQDGNTPLASFTYDDQNRLLDAYDPTGRFTTFEAQTPQYATPLDTQHPHGVKWLNLPGAGSTQQTVTIRAKGEYGGDAWPTMELWVNGVKQQSWTVDNPDWSDYTAQVSLTGRDQIDVVFANDYYQPPIDRNLYVDYVQVGAVTVQAEGATVYDVGAGEDAFDGETVSAGREFINSAGALRFVLGTRATALGYDANGTICMMTLASASRRRAMA
jgi:YD repeat-containing protein